MTGIVITDIRDKAGFETHLMDWLREGYIHCKHGSQDWCQSYLDSAHRYIAALEAALTNQPESEEAVGIDDHEKPRYTTRRLRYEIEKAVAAALLEQAELKAEIERLREALESIADLEGDDLKELARLDAKATIIATLSQRASDALEGK